MSQFVGKTRLAYSRVWHHVDLAEDPRPYGRLASSIALTLMGKHKPIYDPSTDCGDYVVVTNCAQLHTTGKKREQKKYYTHTTRPGSLKSMTMDKLMAKWGGGEILARAVKGMLPKNRLQDDRLARLKCECQQDVLRAVDADVEIAGFEGSAHPYGQNLLKDHTLNEESLSSILENPEVQATLTREAQRTTPAA